MQPAALPLNMWFGAEWLMFIAMFFRWWMMVQNPGIPPQVSSHLFGLRNIGIIPVITHPERNPILQHNPEQVLVWVRQGCAVQATASAFTGFWGEQARRCALWLLEREAVHVLATDAHDDRRRVPILSEARSVISKRFGLDVARALVDDNPGAIVAG